MSVLLQHRANRSIDTVPFPEELFERGLAVRREPVEALVAFVLLAPLTGEESLAFEPAEQGIERALVDRQPVLVERLAQRVAVLLFAQRGEYREDQAAAPQLEAEIVEGIGARGHRWSH